MEIPIQVQAAALKLLDQCAALIPQPLPGIERLKSCKIVSHRGEHDNVTVFENTHPAFELAETAGVWGIECDIRWTKDLHPVVIHDPDCRRLFDGDRVVAESRLAELQRDHPQIPSLESLVRRYGKQLHLMIEIKDEPYPDVAQQRGILGEILQDLIPGEDFHFLALDAQLFQLLQGFPCKSFLPVAELNVRRLSRAALEQNLGGLTGHFYFLNRRIVNSHHRQNQKIGTGFIASKNALFRELNRGVEWVFSNDAGKLQTIVESLLVERH